MCTWFLHLFTPVTMCCVVWRASLTPRRHALLCLLTHSPCFPSSPAVLLHLRLVPLLPKPNPHSLSDLDPKMFGPGVSVAGKSEKELAKQEQVGEQHHIDCQPAHTT